MFQKSKNRDGSFLCYAFSSKRRTRSGYVYSQPCKREEDKIISDFSERYGERMIVTSRNPLEIFVKAEKAICPDEYMEIYGYLKI